MEEAEGIADVALAACVGTDDHCERAEAERLVSEVLKIDESKRSGHGVFLRLLLPTDPLIHSRYVLPYVLPQLTDAGQDQLGQGRPYCQDCNQDAD